MTIILDGKKLSLEVISQLSERVNKLTRKPDLAVVLVGENKGSEAFVRNKQAVAARVGMGCRVFKYPNSISVKDLSVNLNGIVRGEKYDGVIIQLPLPGLLDRSRYSLLRIIPEDRDADCLSEKWQGRLLTGRNFVEQKGKKVELLPPVASAIFKLADKYNISFENKNIVLVGWGDLVGKPLLPLLVRKGATVTVCTSKTKDISVFTKNADIVISGVGKAHIIIGLMLKRGAIVFDAGYTEIDGKTTGDIDTNSVKGVAEMLSPSPGGIGPLTVACLLENVVALSELRQNVNSKRSL